MRGPVDHSSSLRDALHFKAPRWRRVQVLSTEEACAASSHSTVMQSRASSRGITLRATCYAWFPGPPPLLPLRSTPAVPEGGAWSVGQQFHVLTLVTFSRLMRLRDSGHWKHMRVWIRATCGVFLNPTNHNTYDQLRAAHEDDMQGNALDRDRENSWGREELLL